MRFIIFILGIKFLQCQYLWELKGPQLMALCLLGGVMLILDIEELFLKGGKK